MYHFQELEEYCFKFIIKNMDVMRSYKCMQIMESFMQLNTDTKNIFMTKAVELYGIFLI